jgi:hypothetical protein
MLSAVNRQRHFDSECESLHKRKRIGTSEEREDSGVSIMDKKFSQLNQRITLLAEEVSKLKQFLSEDWSKVILIFIKMKRQKKLHDFNTFLTSFSSHYSLCSVLFSHLFRSSSLTFC